LPAVVHPARGCPARLGANGEARPAACWPSWRPGTGGVWTPRGLGPVVGRWRLPAWFTLPEGARLAGANGEARRRLLAIWRPGTGGGGRLGLGPFVGSLAVARGGSPCRGCPARLGPMARHGGALLAIVAAGTGGGGRLGASGPVVGRWRLPAWFTLPEGCPVRGARLGANGEARRGPCWPSWRPGPGAVDASGPRGRLWVAGGCPRWFTLPEGARLAWGQWRGTAAACWPSWRPGTGGGGRLGASGRLWGRWRCPRWSPARGARLAWGANGEARRRPAGHRGGGDRGRWTPRASGPVVGSLAVPAVVHPARGCPARLVGQWRARRRPAGHRGEHGHCLASRREQVLSGCYQIVFTCKQVLSGCYNCFHLQASAVRLLSIVFHLQQVLSAAINCFHLQANAVRLASDSVKGPRCAVGLLYHYP